MHAGAFGRLRTQDRPAAASACRQSDFGVNASDADRCVILIAQRFMTTSTGGCDLIAQATWRSRRWWRRPTRVPGCEKSQVTLSQKGGGSRGKSTTHADMSFRLSPEGQDRTGCRRRRASRRTDAAVPRTATGGRQAGHRQVRWLISETLPAEARDAREDEQSVRTTFSSAAYCPWRMTRLPWVKIPISARVCPFRFSSATEKIRMNFFPSLS